MNADRERFYADKETELKRFGDACLAKVDSKIDGYHIGKKFVISYSDGMFTVTEPGNARAVTCGPDATQLIKHLTGVK